MPESKREGEREGEEEMFLKVGGVASKTAANYWERHPSTGVRQPPHRRALWPLRAPVSSCCGCHLHTHLALGTVAGLGES